MSNDIVCLTLSGIYNLVRLGKAFTFFKVVYTRYQFVWPGITLTETHQEIVVFFSTIKATEDLTHPNCTAGPQVLKQTKRFSHIYSAGPKV